MKNFCSLMVFLLVLYYNKTYSQLADTLSMHHYYSSEVIPPAFQKIYNTWIIEKVAGGTFGTSIIVDFNKLVIQKYGIFKVYRNDSLKCYGHLKVLENDPYQGLLVTFVIDTITEIKWFFDMTKYISKVDSYNLTLTAPCCDRYSYYFKSCDYLINPENFQEKKEIETLTTNCSTISNHFPGTITSMYFFNRDTGFLTNTIGNIIFTGDGGQNWEIKNPGNDISLRKITFINDSTGFAIGGKSFCSGTGCTVPGSILYKTSDFGKTWIQKPIPYAWSELNDICFITNKKGYAVGLGLSIKTDDGGETWQTFDPKITGTVADIEFADEKTGYAGGLNNISKSTDGGLNWFATAIPYSVTCIKFLDPDTGFLSNNSGKILKTINGGQTWNELTNSPTLVNYLFIAGPRDLIACGSKTYSSMPCSLWQSGFHITSNEGNNWMGDIRIDKSFTIFSQYSSDTFYGLSGNRLIQINYLQNTPTEYQSATIKSETLVIFPNPAKEVLNIFDFSEENPLIQYEILHLDGTLILKGSLHHPQIDLKNLTEGIYILKVTKGKNIYIEKFIKAP